MAYKRFLTVISNLARLLCFSLSHTNTDILSLSSHSSVRWPEVTRFSFSFSFPSTFDLDKRAGKVSSFDQQSRAKVNGCLFPEEGAC